MSEPQEYEPDLDELPRAQLHELDGPAGPVADVLDEWLLRTHGVMSSAHNTGLFLDLLADAGYRVTEIGPVPSIDELLPPPTN